MTFAVTISAYQLVDHIHLNVLALRRVFGPELPILISQDWSDKSVEIRDLAERLGTHHLCADSHRGHFAGDLNNTIAALAFAEAEKADVAIKISQRMLLCEPAAREIIEKYFSDPEIWMALPARLHPGTIKRAESRFFANLTTLTDLLCVRTWKLRPTTVKELYEERVNSRKSRHDTLIEALFSFISDVTLAGHCVRMPEFSGHPPGRPPIYLRRSQSEPAQFQTLAAELGLKEFHPLLIEWRQMSAAYRPCPIFQ
jgi:hypothetical protein